MSIKAIVYTTKTGFTEQYAKMLGEKLLLSVYPLKQASKQLSKGDNIIYLGWICAGNIKGFVQAAKRFSVRAVCGVGLCDTGTLTAEVRKATGVPEKIPLFTLQGGFDRSKLKGVDKLMITLLTKGLASQKQRSDQDERMLELLSKDENYVCTENLAQVLQWYKERYI